MLPIRVTEEGSCKSRSLFIAHSCKLFIDPLSEEPTCDPFGLSFLLLVQLKYRCEASGHEAVSSVALSWCSMAFSVHAL